MQLDLVSYFYENQVNFTFSGPLDPTKTGFVGQSSVVVCTQSIRHQLILEPRDEYGNISSYDAENDSPANYKLTITEVSTKKEKEKKLKYYICSTNRSLLNSVLIIKPIQSSGPLTSTVYVKD